MRYAIYYAPEPGSPLDRLANAWLGRDPLTGAAVDRPAIGGLDRARLAALTTSPRRYGFHGTLKAPFRLREGKGERDLVEAMDRFCAVHAAFAVPRVEIGLLDGFLAFQPSVRHAGLDSFAAAVVETFDPFRAALSPQEIARRDPDGLSPPERANLERWGYPYVFAQFRFHMTLSNRLEDAGRDRMLEAARIHFAPVLDRPLAIDALTLFVEPGPGMPFEIQGRMPLAAPAEGKIADVL